MITEATGLPPDENCLHCYLPPLIEAWMEAHGEVEVGQVLLQLAQTVGEVIGSVAPDAKCADRMAVGLLTHIRQNARGTADAKARAPKS